MDGLDEKLGTGVLYRYKHLNAWVKCHTPTIPANIKKVPCELIENSTIYKNSKLY